MKRHVDLDKFGAEIVTEVPDVKRCPVCRSVAGADDVKLVIEAYTNAAELEDNSYG
jgi:hypothetical protein